MFSYHTKKKRIRETQGKLAEMTTVIKVFSHTADPDARKLRILD